MTVRVSLRLLLFKEQSARTPPSTFLFLPIQLSNSRSAGEDLRPQKAGPAFPDLAVRWLIARETLENQMANRPPKASSPSVERCIGGGLRGVKHFFKKDSHVAALTLACGKLRRTRQAPAPARRAL